MAISPNRVRTLAAVGAAATVIGGITYFANSRTNSDLNAFGTSLYFPNDLGSESYPYYMSFSFREYQRRSIFDREFLRDTGMIRLPIPNTIIDSSQVNFSEVGSNMIVGAGIDAALRGSKAASDVVSNFQTGAAAAGAVAGGLAGGAAGAATTLLTGSNSVNPNLLDQVLQIGGVAQNPFLTMMFKSPTFKRHQFSWTFTPSNASETDILRNLINKFKYHQLPGESSAPGGTLLSYPDMCLVGFYPSDRYLYKFKPCVIESCTVNYAAAGQPAFFTATDAPVTISLQLNLIEIEYWMKNDILKA